MDKDFGGAKLARAVREAYRRGLDDYHMEPLVLKESGIPLGKIKDNDSVIFCCRRGEREIELTDMFTDPAFSAVQRKKLGNLYFAILTMYHEKYKSLPIAFAPSRVNMPLAQVLSEAGKTQFHCAESEKFAHVTFFFNGGENNPFDGEDDFCVPSPRGISFDQKPELSLPEVASKVVASLGSYDFIVTNFANGDVIGHTSDSRAKIKACGHVSHYLSEVTNEALAKDYVVAITADHGNIETLYDAKGLPHMAHTSNPVSFILIDPADNRPMKLHDGTLGDVAPTILQVMGLDKPGVMEGGCLYQNHDFGNGRRVLLIICDGWGLGSGDDNDAIHLAETSFWDHLLKDRSHCALRASGSYVGLEDDKPGNSEAGHMNLGAGRCVMQDDVRLDHALKDGSFERNEVFMEAISHARKAGGALHLIAYLTHKSSHGSIDYAVSICHMAKNVDFKDVFLHVVFDGRSTEPGSAPELLMELDGRLREIGIGMIVDGVGRGLALDRDRDYGKVKLAYDAMVEGKGRPYS